MWIVTLIKAPPPHLNYFRDDFFPRMFAFKKDALELVKEVKENGGDAKAEKWAKGDTKVGGQNEIPPQPN